MLNKVTLFFIQNLHNNKILAKIGPQVEEVKIACIVSQKRKLQNNINNFQIIWFHAWLVYRVIFA